MMDNKNKNKKYNNKKKYYKNKGKGKKGFVNTQMLGLKIRHYDKILPVERTNITLKLNEFVIADTNRGIECGQVKLRCKYKSKKYHDIKVNKVIRKAEQKDIDELNKLESYEKNALKVANEKIDDDKISLKIVSVEYIFDNKKVIFSYKKEDKSVKKAELNDFRRQLTSSLKVKRVDFKQVGARAEAKMLGGVGNCGRCLCCASWLPKSRPVTVKMAKQQGLPINIPKLSGVCGRLMCCLRYERDNYENGRLMDFTEIEKYEGIFKKEEVSDSE